MLKKPSASSSSSPFCSLLLFCLLSLLASNGFLTTTAAAAYSNQFKDVEGPFLITKDQRQRVIQTEDGQISAVETSDGIKGTYHLQFITLEPNSLFLPVLLHADMVFYVHTGSGILSWVDEEDNKNDIDVQRGDIYRIPSGSVVYIRSSLESEREKLRIYAIFTTNSNENPQPQTLFTGVYSTLSDLVLGFDKKVLQAAFKVPEEVLDGITRSTKPPAIVHLTSTSEKDRADWRTGIIETLVGTGPYHELRSKKKKTKTFNILKDKRPDFKNCNGWSSAVNKNDFSVLRGSDIGVFMVNLTQGSMMGPHWNPRAGEIAVVTHGQGMIRVVCSSSTTNETSKGCKNKRFRVKEGDIFVVPRFHPMAQMSYNNDSLVFMGFTTQAGRNNPQFLVGRSSVLQTMNKDVLAMSFNVPNTTIDQLLASQVDSIILQCVSCAEEEEMKMQEEIAREKEEEERKREEEERRKREEEEKAREREREEEERRKREEEEKAREREREEEARRQQEEDRRRQEEEAKREEEEARRQEEERQAREEASTREEERRQQERRQQEEARKKHEAAAKREEEESRRQEEERQAREKQEEEEERKQQQREREEEEAAARREEEGRQQQQREREEEEDRRKEEARRAEEEEQREQEKEARRREEEDETRRAKEGRAKEEEQRQQQQQREREEEEADRREEEARRAEEEEQRGMKRQGERKKKRGKKAVVVGVGEGRRILKKM